jgi:phage tail tape-measure protein
MANDHTSSTTRWRYGLLALLIGAITLLSSLLIAGLAWDKDAAALAAATGTVGTIVGAYFGLQVGGAESETVKKDRDDAKAERNTANEQRDRAVKAAMAFSAKLTEDEARPTLQAYGLL